jgi:hypothetical protein
MNAIILLPDAPLFSNCVDNTFPLWFSTFLSNSIFFSCGIDALVDADHFTSVNLREITVCHMVEAQEFTSVHAINLAFVHDLPEAKRAPLLAILTRTDFEDLSHFRDQVAYLQEVLIEYLPNLINYRDLAGALSCKVRSIEFRDERASGPTPLETTLLSQFSRRIRLIKCNRSTWECSPT